MAQQGGGIAPCYFWSIGRCTKGEACPFAHEGVSPKSTQRKLPEGDCFFFSIGTCTKGAACPFRHPTEDKDSLLSKPLLSARAPRRDSFETASPKKIAAATWGNFNGGGGGSGDSVAINTRPGLTSRSKRQRMAEERNDSNKRQKKNSADSVEIVPFGELMRRKKAAKEAVQLQEATIGNTTARRAPGAAEATARRLAALQSKMEEEKEKLEQAKRAKAAAKRLELLKKKKTELESEEKEEEKEMPSRGTRSSRTTQNSVTKTKKKTSSAKKKTPPKKKTSSAKKKTPPKKKKVEVDETISDDALLFDDDELLAVPTEKGGAGGGGGDTAGVDVDNDDDLDALLAEADELLGL
eukprot:g477.t1